MWEHHISLSNSLVWSVVMATGLSFLHLSAYASSLAHSIAEQGVVCSVGVASRELRAELESSSIPLWTILWVRNTQTDKHIHSSGNVLQLQVRTLVYLGFTKDSYQSSAPIKIQLTPRLIVNYHHKPSLVIKYLDNSPQRSQRLVEGQRFRSGSWCHTGSRSWFEPTSNANNLIGPAYAGCAPPVRGGGVVYITMVTVVHIIVRL